jgi:hypothetical protein
VCIRRFLILVTIIMVLALAVAIWLVPPDADFLHTNPYWNGLSHFPTDINVQPYVAASDLVPSTGKVLIVFPYSDFTSQELATFESFVRTGGTLVVADDYGQGNQILQGLGLQARFSGEVLLDPMVCYRNRWLPKSVRITDDPLMQGINSMVLNHATSLTSVTPQEVLAQSSSFSFLDSNQNGSLDSKEASGPFPVIARVPLAEGQLILISDPSLFVNGVLALADNRILAQNLARMATGGFLVDESHLPASNLVDAKAGLSIFYTYIRTPWGTLLFSALALLLLTLLLWSHDKDKSGLIKGELDGK